MRKKVKFNPQLLNEELKKFKLISEYQFFQEAEEAVDDEAAFDDLANDLGVDPEEGGEAQVDEPVNDEPTEEPTEEPVDDIPMEEPVEDTSDDIEVDVTSLVQGSEEAKMAADKASQNTEMLLQKLNDLESRIASMDAVSGKIEDLEKEIIKRNPTPVEKLEMRSLSSFPYSQKLTDYWADKEGAYDVMGNDKKEPEEYTLTQDEIDTTYSEPDIKKSFGVTPDDFEEEDI